MKVFYFIKTFLFLAASSFLVGLFLLLPDRPQQFCDGGVTGIAIIVEKATHGKVPQSVSIFCINAPLLILSFFCVKKKFAILSMLNVVMQTVWLTVMEHLNMPQLIFEEKIFAAPGGRYRDRGGHRVCV